MGKPTPTPSMSRWPGGTSGDDTATVSSLSALKSTIYDAGAGYDTLDLSALTTGVSLQLSQGTQGKTVIPHSNLWADSPFHGSWWSWDPLAQVGTKVTDSILNFEKVIGTSGNDYLSTLQGSYLDGGLGDDSLGGGTTQVGGLGSDQIFGGRSSDIEVGGTFDGLHATPDGTMDEFTLSGGIVLDFEVGVDRLYVDTAAYTISAWTDVTTAYGPGAQIHLTQPNDSRTITLVGVSASTMNALPLGFDTLGAAENTSGPGDDFYYDKYTTASTYHFGTASGHDIIVGFDANVDTLVFPDAPAASSTSYHGDPALLLTFGAGQSSVLLDGFTTADLASLHIQYPDPGITQAMSDHGLVL